MNPVKRHRKKKSPCALAHLKNNYLENKLAGKLDLFSPENKTIGQDYVILKRNCTKELENPSPCTGVVLL